jgi:hypothetical protein
LSAAALFSNAACAADPAEAEVAGVVDDKAVLHTPMSVE